MLSEIAGSTTGVLLTAKEKTSDDVQNFSPEIAKSCPKYSQRKNPFRPPYATPAPAAVGNGKCGIKMLFRTFFPAGGKSDVIFVIKIITACSK
jgi:hypothetical protein